MPSPQQKVEIPAAVVFFDSTWGLSCELIYTAVTRGQKAATMFVSENHLRTALGVRIGALRRTRLTQRILDAHCAQKKREREQEEDEYEYVYGDEEDDEDDEEDDEEDEEDDEDEESSEEEDEEKEEEKKEEGEKKTSYPKPLPVKTNAPPPSSLASRHGPVS